MAEPAVNVAADPRSELLREIMVLANQVRWQGANTRLGQWAGHGESRLLEHLGQVGPQTVPQVARAHLTSRQNIQVMVNRLVAEGCLTLRPNPAHKRSPLVQVTEFGQGKRSQAESLTARLVQALQAELADGEAGTILDALRRVRQRLGQIAPRLEPDSQTELKRGAHGSRTKALPGRTGRPRRVAAPGLREQEIETPAESTELPVNLL